MITGPGQTKDIGIPEKVDAHDQSTRQLIGTKVDRRGNNF